MVRAAQGYFVSCSVTAEKKDASDRSTLYNRNTKKTVILTISIHR